MKRTLTLASIIAAVMFATPASTQQTALVSSMPAPANTTVPVSVGGGPVVAPMAMPATPEVVPVAPPALPAEPASMSTEGSIADIAAKAAVNDVSTRKNPFLPHLTTEEKAISDATASRERQIIEFRSQIRSELMPSIMDEVRRELQQEIQRQAPKIGEGNKEPGAEVAATQAPTGAASAIPGTRTASAAKGDAEEMDPLLSLAGRPQVVKDATFVACVNGKALYRDKTSIMFEQTEDTSSCGAR
jgi:hypothetical protein